MFKKDKFILSFNFIKTYYNRHCIYQKSSIPTYSTADIINYLFPQHLQMQTKIHANNVKAIRAPPIVIPMVAGAPRSKSWSTKDTSPENKDRVSVWINVEFTLIIEFVL